MPVVVQLQRSNADAPTATIDACKNSIDMTVTMGTKAGACAFSAADSSGLSVSFVVVVQG